MAAPDFEQQELGKTDDVFHTTSLTEQVVATDRMVSQAMHDIRILSHDTEPELYGREEFISLLTSFITRRSKVAKIRVLIRDPARAVQHTHRLVQLWHRFPSFIELREVTGDYAKTREALLIVDGIGLIRRPEYENPAAVVTFRNLTTARDRATWFDEAFRHGVASRALRRVSL